MEQAGGAIWSVAIVLGPILLALGIGYGWMQWRHRSRDPNLKTARDEATRQNYERQR
jgi:hypothetical protein